MADPDQHQPIQEEYHRLMNTVAKALDNMFNEGKHGADRETGFVLLVFPFGDGHQDRCNYISNGADRKEIAILFREMAARFEGQAGIVGHG